MGKGSVTYRFCPRETSYGRWGVGSSIFVSVFIFKVYLYAHQSWPCPKCTFVLLYTALNLKACLNNASEALAESKKVRDVSKGGGGGGMGGLQKNVHMTFLVDKIDM